MASPKDSSTTQASTTAAQPPAQTPSPSPSTTEGKDSEAPPAQQTTEVVLGNLPPRYPDLSLDFNLGPTTAARVQIVTTDGKGWTPQELGRLIAFLELQRSFLADEPLTVHVSVSSPQAGGR